MRSARCSQLESGVIRAGPSPAAEALSAATHFQLTLFGAVEISCPVFDDPVFRPNSHAYTVGSTSNVNTVEVMSPPMTTVASGFCTSAPAPCAIAIGTKPSEATSAVIKHGAQPHAGAVESRVLGREAFVPPLLDVAHEHEAVQHRDAEQRDEADARGDRERHAAQGESEDAAGDREGHVQVDERRRASREPCAMNSRTKMSASAIGTTTRRRRVAACRFLNWPPHSVK